MCKPTDVRVRSSWSATRQAIVTTTATTEILRMSTPPITHGVFNSATELAILPSAPNQSSAMLWRRNAIAKVATSITAGDCSRSGRKTSLSMSIESARTTAKQSRIPAHTGQFHCAARARANAPDMISCP